MDEIRSVCVCVYRENRPQCPRAVSPAMDERVWVCATKSSSHRQSEREEMVKAKEYLYVSEREREREREKSERSAIWNLSVSHCTATHFIFVRPNNFKVNNTKGQSLVKKTLWVVTSTSFVFFSAIHSLPFFLLTLLLLLRLLLVLWSISEHIANMSAHATPLHLVHMSSQAPIERPLAWFVSLNYLEPKTMFHFVAPISPFTSMSFFYLQNFKCFLLVSCKPNLNKCPQWCLSSWVM